MTHAAEVPTPPSAPAPLKGVPLNLPRARAVVLLAPFGAALVLYALGWIIMRSFNWLAHEPELRAATFISLTAGLASSIPMALWMARGPLAVVRLTMLAMLVRGAVAFGGLILACGPGWHLDPGILVLCTSAGYLAMLTFENAATIWATRH